MTQQINLLDPALLPQRDWCNGKFIVGIGVTLTLGTLGHLAYEKSTLHSLLASTGAAPHPTAAPTSDPLDAQLAELGASIATNERLLQAVGSFAELPQNNAARLRALFAALPDTLWLHEVEFGVERGVRIAGSALDANALARFAARLGALPAFHGLPLHVFALKPGERADAGSAVGSNGTAPVAEPAHYGFLLSSVDAGRSAGGVR